MLFQDLVLLLSLRSHFYFFLNSNNFHLKTCILKQFFIYLDRTCYRTGRKVIKFVHFFIIFFNYESQNCSTSSSSDLSLESYCLS